MKTKETPCSMFSVRCWMLEVPPSPRSIFHPRSSNFALPLLLLTAAVAQGQPVITQQPQHCTNIAGTTATFRVTATGSEPLAYQWQKLSPSWTDQPGCIATNLVLTNVQTSLAGDYRVVITNAQGSVTSDVAHLTVLVPPRITPTATFQHRAAYRDSSVIFSATASGITPLAYQWQLDGVPLPNNTTSTLTIAAAQPSDEGDYTLLVTNVAGAVTSAPARLWVVPPLTEYIRGNFTNQAGQRMPYFYWVPANYSAARSYPLSCSFHGGGDDVNVFPTRPIPERLILASYRLQATDPAIIVYPTRWYPDEDWTATYLQLTSGLLDQLISQFNIDTNRVYVGGYSQGVHAAWDLLGMRPGFFAAGDVAAGGLGSTPAAALRDVPFWVACAQDDGGLGNTRTLVRLLRQAGGNPIYTEYRSGGHLDGILMHVRTPVVLDWFRAQRRGLVSTHEPLLTITSPTADPTYRTGAGQVSLAGTAAAFEEPVTQIAWTNFANNAKGLVSGSNAWSVADIPLVANKTNLIIVVGTTTSWAPAYGGNTTFSDSIFVVQSPLRATLTLQGTGAVLKWTGGGPPYRVQRATDLAAGDWTDFLTDAVPPVSLPVEGEVAFYRVVGQ